jgi:Xaa-Pro aminopeptidase
MLDIKPRIKENLAYIRQIMAAQNIDAFVITGTDAHQSEYIAEYWNSRQWATGFTGSAGQVVITQDFAGLWTDSRYFLQGESELEGTGYQLMKQSVQFNPEYIEWIEKNLAKDAVVMLDGYTVSTNLPRTILKIFNNKFQIIFDDKVLPIAWKDRPSLPMTKCFNLEEKYTGESAKSKFEWVRQFLEKHQYDGILLSSLDDIAYLLNIRAGDVDYNPVCISYCYISLHEVIWFVDNTQLPDILPLDNIVVKPYETASSFLEKLEESNTIAIDLSQLNVKIKSALKCKTVAITNPVVLKKSQKNPIELHNIKKAMINDGIALAKSFYWLENEINDNSVSEHRLSEVIAQYRSESTDYIGESFGAIIGYKGNGAIVHYKPDKRSSASIRNEGVLLCDSGGQYKTGTTDITRTFGLKGNNDIVKRDYTCVLKGMIALSRITFPKGTTGAQLDILARQFLWSLGLNYSHGTGHGVGFCLNVHEGPQGFAPISSERGRTPLLEGMILSNEPGYYKEGEYGIRIENLMVVQPHETYKDFFKFETLTLSPIDLILLDKTMLSQEEITFINEYHHKVFNKLSPHLDTDVRNWLEEKCKEI